MGGLVPHSYYFDNRPTLNNANKKRLKVANGSKEQLEFRVESPGSTLRYLPAYNEEIDRLIQCFYLWFFIIRWEFFSEGGDIGFAIYQSNERKVVSKGRIVAEEGQISTEPGRCNVSFRFHWIYRFRCWHCSFCLSDIVEFNNTFSYLRSKIIWYAIYVDTIWFDSISVHYTTKKKRVRIDIITCAMCSFNTTRKLQNKLITLTRIIIIIIN